MALQGIMVNSRMEWNCEYLSDLREKFRQQEYPLNVINDQFRRALTVNRDDLLLRNPSVRKKRKMVIAPLVVTFNPGNPPGFFQRLNCNIAHRLNTIIDYEKCSS